MFSKSRAIHLRVVLIVHVDQSATPQYALVSQAIWEYHQNVDRNASLAPNALLQKPVSTSNAKILALELVVEMRNAKLLTTTLFACVLLDGLVIL
jgi:hypothetical protein